MSVNEPSTRLPLDGAEVERIIGESLDEMQVSLKVCNDVTEDLAKPHGPVLNRELPQVFKRMKPCLFFLHDIEIRPAQLLHELAGLLCGLHVILQTIRQG